MSLPESEPVIALEHSPLSSSRSTPPPLAALIKGVFVFQTDGGFQTPVVFCLSTYFSSLSLTTGWGLIPGIYLSGLAASLMPLLKTYFNEMPVRRNNNLYGDVSNGFEVKKRDHPERRASASCLWYGVTQEVLCLNTPTKSLAVSKITP